MEASKVYYTDFRCPIEVSLPEKLRRLCIAAGIKDIDMDGKFASAPRSRRSPLPRPSPRPPPSAPPIRARTSPAN